MSIPIVRILGTNYNIEISDVLKSVPCMGCFAVLRDNPEFVKWLLLDSS